MGVELVVGRLQRDEHRARAGKGHRRHEILVERLNDHDLVPRIDDAHQSNDDGLGHATRDCHVLIGVDPVHAVLPAELAGDGLASGRPAPGDAVLVVIQPDSIDGSLFHRLRCGEVRIALRQIDGVMLIGQPGHLADDRFLEADQALCRVHRVYLTPNSWLDGWLAGWLMVLCKPSSHPAI